MEYCDEGTIAEVAKAGLPEEMIRNYTREITVAISVLHERGIVHRDVKGKGMSALSVAYIAGSGRRRAVIGFWSHAWAICWNLVHIFIRRQVYFNIECDKKLGYKKYKHGEGAMKKKMFHLLEGRKERKYKNKL